MEDFICGNMFFQFVLLFFTALRFGSGDIREFLPNPHQYVYHQNQQYVNQAQQYVNQQSGSESFFDKPTSRREPRSLPKPAVFEIIPSQVGGKYEGPSNSSDKRISDKKCFETYIEGRYAIHVAGGRKTNDREFYYMAAIGYRRPTGGISYGCGGSLISESFILTAAHCRASNGQKAAVARIGGGRLNSSDPFHQPREITDVISHPHYRRKQVYNDIALLKLKDAISYIDPVCLWIQNDINHKTATAIGYGQTGFGLSTSADLLKVDLELYSSQVCQQFHTPRYSIERGLIDSQLCAGDFSKVRDTCPGDSGGALSTKIQGYIGKIPIGIDYILAVTSFGLGCAEGIPGVYTKVSSYLDWIEAVVWPGE